MDHSILENYERTVYYVAIELKSAGIVNTVAFDELEDAQEFLRLHPSKHSRIVRQHIVNKVLA